MTSRLLRWPRRAVLHLRGNGGSLAVVVGVAVAFLALEYGVGRISGRVSALVIFLGVPLVLSSGGFGVRSGAATLWVQKPVNPHRYYLAGTAWRVALSTGMTVILLSLFGIAAISLGWDPPQHPIWMICLSWAVPLVVASMTSGASMWLPRTGWLLTLAAAALTMALRLALLLDMASVDQRWVQLTRLALPPWESLATLLTLTTLDPSMFAWALVRILVYAAVWIGVGVLGLNRLMTNGGLCRVGP